MVGWSQCLDWGFTHKPKSPPLLKGVEPGAAAATGWTIQWDPIAQNFPICQAEEKPINYVDEEIQAL